MIQRATCIKGPKWPQTELSNNNVKYNLVIALHENNNKICVQPFS